MDAMQNLLTRRSVKKYKSDMVPEDVIARICEAGTYAATGRNLQAPIILAVTNKELGIQGGLRRNRPLCAGLS